MSRARPSRRHFLRGASAAIALPWLESLAPRPARGQGELARRRFVAMYFPLGTPTFWAPTGTGAGDAWQLSPLLQPLAPLKSQVSVLSHVGNYSPWGGPIEPANANLCGAWLTCVPASGLMDANRGISVDQVMSKALGNATPLGLLQVGLSTLNSYTDGLPAPQSRSISWQSATAPLGKIVSPQAVFDTLFGAGRTPRPDTSASDRSVLDQVLAQASALQTTVSSADRARLDEYLTSVRAVEAAIAATPTACPSTPRPTETYGVDVVPPDYNRDHHADLMIDLVALALQCDVTRFVSFMLDDARSDFVYDFLTMRNFTPTGSTPGTGQVGGLHGLSEAGSSNDGWATIVFWFVQKLAQLCTKLAAVQDGPGGTLLDQSVVWFGSEMHNDNEDALDLPLLYVGSGGGRLAVDQHLDLVARPRGSEDLANVYLTFLRKVFDLPDTSFGQGAANYVDAGHQIVPEILA